MGILYQRACLFSLYCWIDPLLTSITPDGNRLWNELAQKMPENLNRAPPSPSHASMKWYPIFIPEKRARQTENHQITPVAPQVERQPVSDFYWLKTLYGPSIAYVIRVPKRCLIWTDPATPMVGCWTPARRWSQIRRVLALPPQERLVSNYDILAVARGFVRLSPSL